jgi:tRNA-2-methylthio-N6-dimethylallyladenosine synthase
LQHLQATVEDNVRRIGESRVGSVQRSLVEGASRKSALELMGRTECNRIVNFDAGPQGQRLVGQMIDVRITEALPHSLRGEVLHYDLNSYTYPASTGPQSIGATNNLLRVGGNYRF